MSPWKGHLKIADTVIHTRKVAKSKPKGPPALTGNQLYDLMKKKQEEKRIEAEKKENRKKERELKKALKEKRPVKRRIA